MYPLRFQPIFRHYLWGGRRLATELNKPIGQQTCAESWEVVDRPEDNSLVAAGPFAGMSLHQLIQQQGEALLGPVLWRQVQAERLPDRLRGRFPLLLKFLDAHQTLSVQVHPDDTAGLQQATPDLGKTEAWYVLNALPHSKIYAGLRAGVDRKQLAEAVAARTTDQLLHTFEPRPGDCIFVPAGTVHAIGEGLLIAEIQQSSDTTFRLFDWNRVDTDGQPRDLHVELALRVTDYQRGPVNPQLPCSLADPRVVELVRCEQFQIHRWTLQQDTVELQMEDACTLLMVVEGEIRVAGDPTGQPLSRGQSMLLPAQLQRSQISSQAAAQLLEIRVPPPQDNR